MGQVGFTKGIADPNTRESMEVFGQRTTHIPAYKIVTVTADYTVKRGIRCVQADTTSAAIAITIPDLLIRKGKYEELVIQHIAGNAAVNPVTISPVAPVLINGGASVTINANYGRKTIYTDGTNCYAA